MPVGGGGARPDFDVFISYARTPDLPRVRELKRYLEAAGLAVWLDETAVESFEDITDGTDGEVKHERTGKVTPPQFPYTYPGMPAGGASRIRHHQGNRR